MKWRPLSKGEMADFFGDRSPTLSEIAAVVLGQYSHAVELLWKDDPIAAEQLSVDLYLWAAPALTSLTPVHKAPGRILKINKVKTLQRAYELIAYDHSSVDPIEVEKPGGLPVEVNTDLAEPEKAAGEAL
jgi:hypothetical protein